MEFVVGAASDVAMLAEGSVVAGGGLEEGDEDVVGTGGTCIDVGFGSVVDDGVGAVAVTVADAVAGSLKALIHPLSTKKS